VSETKVNDRSQKETSSKQNNTSLIDTPKAQTTYQAF